ncbi:MAG TPA: carboxypeptidase-like regulatory domain-containing protein [Gemmatimonadaceae bacterium]|nr:carboxypeptidase-like regulatory domain-containing protein [Gemmatimonadaceae bacterium]
MDGSRVMRWLAVIALVACAARPAHGQELRGTVRDSATGGVIPGAVLLLRDANGTTIGRNLTNERGEFRLADIDAVRSLQVLRIGFRPRVLVVSDAARAGHERLDVMMARIPQLLDVVEVNDQPACPRRADRPKAFALWEQARAELLATVVARDENPALAEALEFDRTLDPRRDTVITQTVRMRTGRTTHPFVAAKPARQFIENGFASAGSSVRTFYGPDADVLLDPAFARAYCFQLQDGPKDRPREIGLAFTPARHERDHIDLEGTLWVDTVARSLTRLDFRYLGVSSRERDLHAGGLISFRTMPNGVPIIDRWYLRLITFRDPIGPLTRASMPVPEPHEGGGEIAIAKWDSGVTWEDSLGTVQGTVSAFDKPVPHAAIQLAGTDYRAETDSLGRFEISHLLPGPYEVMVDEPTLDELALEITRGERFRAARDSVVHLAVTMPTLHDVVRRKCSDARQSDEANLIAGRARYADGAPAGRATLLLRDLGPADGPAAKPVSQVGAPWALGAAGETTIEDRTGDDGRFYLCNIPQNARLLVIVQNGTGAAAAQVVTWGAKRAVFPVLLNLESVRP